MKLKSSMYTFTKYGKQDYIPWTELEFSEIERSNPEGITTQQVVEIFTARGERLTEATFRKYVQLGLLPRSVRIGRKGRHRGSQGLYPATVIRQIDVIRGLMAQGLTIEEIQRDFPFLAGDINELSQRLKKVFSSIELATSKNEPVSSSDQVVLRALSEARTAAEDLLNKLRSIEGRLLMRARMARAAV
jgi:DNA-binding transcriptional MerR regulator